MSYTYNASCEKLNITTAATNTVFIGNGRLVSITINKALTGAIKVLDNNTGTTANIATIASGTIAQTLWYNCSIGLGLIIVNASTEDITVTFIRDNI